MHKNLTPEIVLQAYRSGIFPMAENRNDKDIFWIEPKQRGLIPLNGFHISRSLKRRLLRKDYLIKINTSFPEVVSACADRPETWINKIIFDIYCALNDQGVAHSLEVWKENNLIGGVYGVSQGSAFFGESMFSKERDASKIALAFLVHRLKKTGFMLLDTQFPSPHLISLGAKVVSKETYKILLKDAIKKEANFLESSYSVATDELLHLNGHTS